MMLRAKTRTVAVVIGEKDELEAKITFLTALKTWVGDAVM
jgi:hypothetical protein